MSYFQVVKKHIKFCAVALSLKLNKQLIFSFSLQIQNNNQKI